MFLRHRQTSIPLLGGRVYGVRGEVPLSGIKPRPQDSAALHEAFGGEDVSVDVSRTEPIQTN